MGHSIEYAEAIKDSEGWLRKINSVRKYKGVMLLYELVGSNDRQLKLFDREVEECSCVMRKDMKINNNKPNKKINLCR